jgi:rubrerythrin
MIQLIKMLQKAHAGEIAAFHAYQGHWKALPPGEHRAKIQEIQKDEEEHRKIVRKLLTYFDSKPSFARDLSFLICGHILSALCYVTGWLLPMKGALFIEKIGAASYWEMMELAIIGGYPEIAMILLCLAKKEEEHKEFFEKLIYESHNNRSGQHVRI